MHETAEAEASSGQHVDVELQVRFLKICRAQQVRCMQKMSQWARYIASDVESFGVSVLNDDALRAMLAGWLGVGVMAAWCGDG